MCAIVRIIFRDFGKKKPQEKNGGSPSFHLVVRYSVTAGLRARWAVRVPTREVGRGGRWGGTVCLWRISPFSTRELLLPDSASLATGSLLCTRVGYNKQDGIWGHWVWGYRREGEGETGHSGGCDLEDLTGPPVCYRAYSLSVIFLFLAA